MRWIPIVVLAALPLAAQRNPEQKWPPFVRVHGEAVQKVQPDHAQIDIGITTQSKSAEAASDDNGRQAAEVMAQLKAAAPAGQIRTVNYSVNPNYEYPKNGGTPTITGYTVNNTVRVDLDDLKLVQKVIDASTRSGANQISRLDFSVKDEQPARAKALAEAVTQAKASARAMAEGLQLKLGKVLQLEASQPGNVIPMRQEMMATARAKTADTPISAGEIEIRVNVDAAFELIQ